MAVAAFVCAHVADAAHRVRIEVDTTAIYGITYDELTAAGFSDPSKVSVWGYGGCADINDIGRKLPQVPALHRNGMIYFYGLGPAQVEMAGVNATRLRNAYSSAGSYFLTDAAENMAPESCDVTVPDNADKLTTHMAAMLWEREDTCPARGGTEWFTGNVAAWGDGAVDFTVSAMAEPTVRLYARYAMYTTRSNSVTFKAPDGFSELSTSRTRAGAIGSREGNVFTRGNVTMRYQASSNNPTGLLRFKPVIEHAEAIDYALIDYVTLTYTRHNDLNGLTARTMHFIHETDGAYMAEFTGVQSTTEIWDVTDAGKPKALTVRADGTVPVRITDGAATLVAFDTAKPQRRVRLAEHCDTDHDIMQDASGAEMVIIAATPLTEQACELAEIHRELQSMNVTVADQQDIFNAYSSGTQHPEAIRRYVADVKRTSDKLRYLLVYGAASYNNRRVAGPKLPYVVAYQCESETYSNNSHYAFMSDDYFALTDDRGPISGTGALLKQARIATGRLAVASPAQGRVINAKIRQWISKGPERALSGKALLMCDSGDENSHMHFTCSMASMIDSLSGRTAVVTKAYPQLHGYAVGSKTEMPAIRRTIGKALTQGTGFMLYAGHCDVSRLGRNYIWRTSDAGMESAPAAVALLATCDALSTDRYSTDISRAMLFNRNGGAMGVIAACRTVLQSFNEQLATDVVRAMYDDDRPLTLGELYMNARTATMARAIAGGNMRLAVNTWSYGLAGDPAVPIYNATGSITASLPDGKLKAGGLNRITGSVSDDFRAVDITVYAAADTVMTYLRKPDAEEPVRVAGRVLARVKVPVDSCRFDSEFYLPAEAMTEGPLRVTLHAMNRDGAAAGVIDKVTVSMNEDVDSVLASEKLVIEEFEVRESGRQGVMVHALIAGGRAGVAMTDQPGAGTRLTLDGNRTMPGVSASLLPTVDGKAILDYSITDMADGKHILELTARTATGAEASARTEFTIVSVDSVMIQTDGAAVAHEARISLESVLPDDAETALMITGMNGRTVRYVTQPVMPYVWDLTDDDGEPVATGRYRAVVMTRRGNRHGASQYAIITVIRDRDEL